MTRKRGAVIVLVCPKCGTKYRGDTRNPDAVYQCPVDKTELVRERPGAPVQAGGKTEAGEPESAAAESATPEASPPAAGDGQPEGAATPEPAAESASTTEVKPEEGAAMPPSWVESMMHRITSRFYRSEGDAPKAAEKKLSDEDTVDILPVPPKPEFELTSPEPAPAAEPASEAATETVHEAAPPEPTPQLAFEPPPDAQEPAPAAASAEEHAETLPYHASTVAEEASASSAAPKADEAETVGYVSPTHPETPVLQVAESAALAATVEGQAFSRTGSLPGFEERRSVVAALGRLIRPESGGRPAVGKYETRDKLGEGGVGEVMKVLDRDLNREVAMKMLRGRDGGVPEDLLLRFVKEAQATGGLEHPNIVPVHDLGVDAQGRVYFTLKYVQGVSLKEVIRGRQENRAIEGKTKFRDVYSPLQMIEVLIGICQGVAYAHSKGVIHRDLKPENVMLGKFGEVLVMDWGLAKGLEKRASADPKAETILALDVRGGDDSTKTIEGAIAGTPAYMPPEQAEGKISELNERSDVYALGAILYEMLTGQPPYRGGSALEIVQHVVKGPPPALSGGSHGFKPIPRELKAICEKAMARQQRDRYASATALRDELQAYLENRPVAACPDSPLQRAQKWVRRNRHQVQVGAVSAAAVLVLVFGSWYVWRQTTINRYLNDARYQMKIGKTAYDQAKAGVLKVREDDPYRAMLLAMAQGDTAAVYRSKLNTAIETARKVLDISPQHSGARAVIADAYMEMWRLALAEGNNDLASAARSEVEYYAPSPNPYLDELNGYGRLELTFDPPDAIPFLYVFTTLRATDQDGNALAPRLIPVPYDLKDHQMDQKFLEEEKLRAMTGPSVMTGTHSIFHLEPTSTSALGRGNVSVGGVPPGSYLLYVLAAGHQDVRVPLLMERMGKIERKIVLPTDAGVPAGFFYVAGGDAIIGGDTANAMARHTQSIAPFLMYHDEITMGDWADFLRDLVKTGKAAEAQRHVPRDFGKPLAVLSKAGDLTSAAGVDTDKFLRSAVRGVSYNDVMAYIGWRTQRDHLPYRLPTEFEWEGACRGADGRRYSWGNLPGRGLAIVTQGYGDTGANISWKWEDYKDESPWGVHNLAGGVAEWTSSHYDEKAKPSDPVYGQYAIRGNAWSLPPTGLDCAFRTSGQPDYFHPTIGFRLALDFPVKTLGGETLVPVVGASH